MQDDCSPQVARIPEELRAAIERHVAPGYREEFLLDVLDALHTFRQRGDHARVGEYVRECVASLSMDRSQFDLT